MTDLQQKVIQRLQLLRSHGPQWTTLVNILDALIAKVNAIEKMEGPVGPKGDRGDVGEAIVGPRGEKGEKGDTVVGPRGERGLDGKIGAMGPIGKPGRDGKDGKSIIGPAGKDGSPDTADQVRDKLSELKGDKRLDASAIKNFPKPTIVDRLPAITLFNGQRSGGSPVKEIVAGTGVSVSKTDSGKHIISASSQTLSLTFVIDGGGSAITTGVKGDLEIPFACTITQATLLADQSGSIVIDIWKDTYANYPPTVADTITASAKPTLSTATKSQDSTLTGWTTAISAGDTLRFNVDSITTVQRVTLSLRVTK